MNPSNTTEMDFVGLTTENILSQINSLLFKTSRRYTSLLIPGQHMIIDDYNISMKCMYLVHRLFMRNDISIGNYRILNSQLVQWCLIFDNNTPYFDYLSLLEQADWIAEHLDVINYRHFLDDLVLSHDLSLVLTLHSGSASISASTVRDFDQSTYINAYHQVINRDCNLSECAIDPSDFKNHPAKQTFLTGLFMSFIDVLQPCQELLLERSESSNSSSNSLMPISSKDTIYLEIVCVTSKRDDFIDVNWNEGRECADHEPMKEQHCYCHQLFVEPVLLWPVIVDR